MGKIKDKIMNRIMYQLTNDSSFIDTVVDKILEDIDYSEVADNIDISASDIAYNINETDLAEKVAENIDMDELTDEIEIDYAVIAKILKKDIDLEELYKDIIKKIKEDLND